MNILIVNIQFQYNNRAAAFLSFSTLFLSTLFGRFGARLLDRYTADSARGQLWPRWEAERRIQGVLSSQVA